MVAGGVGLAPFPLQVERALAAGVPRENVQLLFGARDAGGLYDLEALRASGIELRLATEDGSVGHRGFVTELLAEELAREIPRSYLVCGPDPMMAAARRLLARAGARAWFSLETYMGCGLGVCNGCIVPVTPSAMDGWPHAKACAHGPVFSIEELAPEALEGERA
jgi:dihydroorotate dehydrogenase electron transfer subunit